MAALAAVPQLAIDERVIEDAELEDALERREKAKAKAAAARKAFATVQDEAKGLLGRHELGEAPVRVGRFVVTARALPARSVAFDTDPSTRISIRVAKDADA